MLARLDVRLISISDSGVTIKNVMKRDIAIFVSKCSNCQQIMVELKKLRVMT